MNYVDVFLEAMSAEKGRSRNTLVAYANDLNHANENIPGGLLGATESDIQKYLADTDACASSVARRASALRSF